MVNRKSNKDLKACDNTNDSKEKRVDPDTLTKRENVDLYDLVAYSTNKIRGGFRRLRGFRILVEVASPLDGRTSPVPVTYP